MYGVSEEQADLEPWSANEADVAQVSQSTHIPPRRPAFMRLTQSRKQLRLALQHLRVQTKQARPTIASPTSGKLLAL